MTSDKTSLGDRMKRYERATAFVLPRRTYTIIRVDGRSFHRYLKDEPRPYSVNFALQMDTVARKLCREISGAVLAYTQSDEISVLVQDFATNQTEPWFGGNVQKIASVAASFASSALYGLRGSQGPPAFDGRVFTIPDPVEVANYLVWRQKDATRNSISMLAQHYFSHRELQGVNNNGMQEMLFRQHGVNWNDQPEGFKRGRLIYRQFMTSQEDARWISESPRFYAAYPEPPTCLIPGYPKEEL